MTWPQYVELCVPRCPSHVQYHRWFPNLLIAVKQFEQREGPIRKVDAPEEPPATLYEIGAALERLDGAIRQNNKIDYIRRIHNNIRMIREFIENEKSRRPSEEPTYAYRI
jgi:hypothetical protein